MRDLTASVVIRGAALESKTEAEVFAHIGFELELVRETLIRVYRRQRRELDTYFCECCGTQLHRGTNEPVER